jgi:hypothetical protein
MAPRLNEEEQKQIDESWDKALSPIDRLDHNALLDAMVVTGAYQRGVDRLMFYSEKSHKGGKVVMEIYFERASPDKDRFEIHFFDLSGKMIRHERYERQEVDTTYRDLFVNAPRHENIEPEPPAAARARETYRKRLAKIKELFPRLEDRDK